VYHNFFFVFLLPLPVFFSFFLNFQKTSLLFQTKEKINPTSFCSQFEQYSFALEKARKRRTVF